MKRSTLLSIGGLIFVAGLATFDWLSRPAVHPHIDREARPAWEEYATILRRDHPTARYIGRVHLFSGGIDVYDCGAAGWKLVGPGRRFTDCSPDTVMKVSDELVNRLNAEASSPPLVEDLKAVVVQRTATGFDLRSPGAPPGTVAKTWLPLLADETLVVTSGEREYRIGRRLCSSRRRSGVEAPKGTYVDVRKIEVVEGPAGLGVMLETIVVADEASNDQTVAE